MRSGLQRQCRVARFVLICRLRLLAVEEFGVLCYLVGSVWSCGVDG